MRKLLISTLAATAFAAPVFAVELSTDMTFGTTVEEATTTLAGMGYEVRKSEMEDGQLELYVVGENTMAELYIDTTTGKAVRIKMK